VASGLACVHDGAILATMQARICVYWRRPVAGPDWLARSSNGPDYVTAAEAADLDEAMMDAAIEELQIAANGDIT
jgi:hypothetical protein